MNSNKKIVLVKLASMGDIVASSSHATEIKKRFPNCEVHLLTMAHMESIAKRIPKIDKLILVPNKFKFQDMRQFLIAFLQVLGNKYDLAFNFHRNWLINLFLRFALVKRSYGFSSKINNFLLSKSLEFDIYKNRTLQEVDLLNLSGIRIKSPSSLQIQNIDKRFELGSVQHYYCISLGGGNYFSEAKNRIWPVGKYVELAKKLDDNCILLGKGENDQLLAKSFQDSYPNKKLINLVDELNIDQTIGILAKAKFFVGNDSGLSYISASLKIPTFIVFGPTPCSSAKPLGENVTAIIGKSHCSPCYNPLDGIKGKMYTCTSNICLQSVDADTVLSSIRKVL